MSVQTKQWTTASVSGNSSSNLNLALDSGINEFFLLKIEITPSAAGYSSYKIYRDDTFSGDIAWEADSNNLNPYYDPAWIDAYDNVSNEGSGHLIYYEDEDASEEFHIHISNEDATARTYTVKIYYVIFVADIDSSGNVVFNESGADADFRIESDTDTHAFFLQGSDGKVGIGTSNPSALLEIGSVTPTWSASLTDGLAVSAGVTGRLYLEGSSQADIVLDDSGATDDYKLIQIKNSAGTFEIRRLTDSIGLGETYFSINLSTGNLSLSGDCDVSGELTAGTKTFKIDHPVDPENKELYHMAIEGPRADLIYRGTVKLVKGKATINLDKDATVHPMLDGTFEALTQNAAVTSLQPVDSFSRVKCSAVTGNQFTIESEDAKSTDEVTWVVMAERKDPFIKAMDKTDADGHLVPEQDKPEPDMSKLEPEEQETDDEAKVGTTEDQPVDMKGKGYYLHPDAYGVDRPTKKITYTAKQEQVEKPTEKPVDKPTEKGK